MQTRGIPTIVLNAVLLAACGAAREGTAEVDGSVEPVVDAARDARSAPDAKVPIEPGLALSWWKLLGSPSAEFSGSTAIDASGNVYIAMAYHDGLLLGGQSLPALGHYDVLVAKFDPAGDLLWETHFGSVGQDEGNSLVLAPDGNLLIGANFDGEISVGDELLSSEDSDFFLAKLTPDGSVLWARQFGGSGHDYVTGIAAQGSRIALTGGYGEPGVNFGGSDLPESRFGSMFVLVVDEDGRHVWSHGNGGEGPEQGREIAFDSAGGVLLVGRFASELDFGDGILREAQGPADALVLRYQPDGELDWAESFSGIFLDSADGLAIHGDEFYVAGLFRNEVQVGGDLLVSVDGYTSLRGDAFIAKMTLSGEVLWARSVGSAGNDSFKDVAVDGSGRPIAVGMAEGPVDLGQGELAGPDEDPFLVRFDSMGEVLFSARYSGPEYGLLESVAMGPGGTVVASGRVRGELNVGTETTPHRGNYDTVLLHLTPSE